MNKQKSEKWKLLWSFYQLITAWKYIDAPWVWFCLIAEIIKIASRRPFIIHTVIVVHNQPVIIQDYFDHSQWDIQVFDGCVFSRYHLILAPRYVITHIVICGIQFGIDSLISSVVSWNRDQQTTKKRTWQCTGLCRLATKFSHWYKFFAD